MRFYECINDYLPREAIEDPSTLTAEQLNIAYIQFQSTLPDKPGTDLSVLDLIDALSYYQVNYTLKGKRPLWGGIEESLHDKLIQLTWHIGAQNAERE